MVKSKEDDILSSATSNQSADSGWTGNHLTIFPTFFRWRDIIDMRQAGYNVDLWVLIPTNSPFLSKQPMEFSINDKGLAQQ